MGLASMVLCFAIGVLTYLGCKINRDIKRKFLSDDQSDEEEEGEDDDKNADGQDGTGEKKDPSYVYNVSLQ